MGNVMSGDAASPATIYRHSGFSSTISSSFSSPSTNLTGIGWDGTNILSTDNAVAGQTIYRHSGFSSTISSSFSSPSTQPQGAGWDGTNLLSTDNSSDFIYRHSGFSSTVSDSFSSASSNPSQVAWDNTNVYNADNTSDAIYKHVGFSSTISSSFSSPSTTPTGLGYNSSSILSADSATDSIYRHTGFSSTITDSFSSPSTGPHGVADDSWSGVGIAFDTASNSGYQATASSYEWAHTIAGSNRWLKVGISMLSVAGASVTSIGFKEAISVTNLTAGTDTTDDSDSTTASITPSANKLILVTVTSRKATETAEQPTITGCNLTWVAIDTNVYDATGSTRRVTLFRAMGSSPTSGALTIDWGGQTQTSKAWVVDEITGADTSGTNGSGAIVQFANNNAAASTSLTVTLGAFASVANATYGGFGNAGEGNMTAGTGFALTSANQQIAGEVGAVAEFRATNDTGVDITSPTADIGGVAIEIKPRSTDMSLIGAVASVSGAVRSELWGLVAPALGTGYISVILSTGLISAGCATSFTGVEQTSPIEGFNSASATNVGAADATVSVTTVAANDWVVDQVATDDTAITVGADQLQRNNVTGAGGSGADSTEGQIVTPAATTMSWTNVAALATWSITAVAVRPVAAGPIVPPDGNTIVGWKSLLGVGQG